MDAGKTGKYIAECRKQKGLTQRELAEQIGVTDKAVSRWETGKGMPEISLLQPLAAVLDTSVGELLEGEPIVREQLSQKSDEIIMDALRYSGEMLRKIIKWMLLTAGIIVLLLGTVVTGSSYWIYVIPGVGMVAAGLLLGIYGGRQRKMVRKGAERMKKWISVIAIVCLAAALVMEILPIGAVLVFAAGPDERIKESFSYFSLTPFGYANFFPLFAGIATAAAVLCCLIGILFEKEKLKNTAFILNISALIFSLLPFLMSRDYMNLFSWIISLLLLLALAAQAMANGKKK